MHASGLGRGDVFCYMQNNNDPTTPQNVMINARVSRFLLEDFRNTLRIVSQSFQTLFKH